MSRNDTMDDNKKKPKSKKQKTECTNLEHHVKETTIGCFEEKNHQYLKFNYYLYKVKCSKCQRNIAHATNAKEIDKKRNIVKYKETNTCV